MRAFAVDVVDDAAQARVLDGAVASIDVEEGRIEEICTGAETDDNPDITEGRVELRHASTATAGQERHASSAKMYRLLGRLNGNEDD